jgi:hypothetical protein
MSYEDEIGNHAYYIFIMVKSPKEPTDNKGNRLTVKVGQYAAIKIPNQLFSYSHVSIQRMPQCCGNTQRS